MPEPLFVDSSYVIALMNINDRNNAQARLWAERFMTHPLITTDAVLLEIGNALSRNGREKAIRIIHRALTADEIEIVHLNPVLFRAGLELYEAYKDKTWGLVDCVSFTVMREMHLPTALTFDKHFTQAGFRIPNSWDDSA